MTGSQTFQVNFDDWRLPRPPHGQLQGDDGERAASAVGGQHPPRADVSVEVIVCVHNALEHVDRCLASVLPTLQDADQLILVDDCSEPPTRALLEDRARSFPDKLRLVKTPERLYYSASASLGLSYSQADLAILLNSDTVVPGSWLTKLTRLAFMDDRIGIVGPLSNAAHLQSIPSITPSARNSAVNPLPPGVSVDEMDALCERWSADYDIPLCPYIHGFCYGIKKDLRLRVGAFDTLTFPHGYGEENDYSFRAADAGYVQAVAIDTFVYHAKSQSYPDAERWGLMQSSYASLVAKYGSRPEWSDSIFRQHPILQAMRSRAGEFYQAVGQDTPADSHELTASRLPKAGSRGPSS